MKKYPHVKFMIVAAAGNNGVTYVSSLMNPLREKLSPREIFALAKIYALWLLSTYYCFYKDMLINHAEHQLHP